MEEVVRRMDALDEEILRWTDERDGNIRNIRCLARSLHDVRLRLLRVKLAEIEAPTQIDLKKLALLSEKADIAHKFIVQKHTDLQAGYVQLMSIITAVCLPLGVITGAFGMNFGFMGIDPRSRGVLRWKAAPAVLLGLVICSVALSLVVTLRSR